MGEYVSLTNRQKLLTDGIEFGVYTLASGEESNVKFEFDNIQGESFRIAVDGLARCIKDNYDENDFNAIVTVATGANRLGGPLVETLQENYHMNTRHVPSCKDTLTGKLYVPPLVGPFSRAVPRALLVDDVYTTGKSLEAVKDVIEKAEGRKMYNDAHTRRWVGEVVGAAVLLNRSENEAPRLSGGKPVFNVIHHILG